MNCNAPINSWWRSHVTFRTLYLLFLGQLVSFTLALLSFISSLIADLGVDAPVTQSAFTYFSLALVYGGVLLYRRQRLRVAWYWYLLLGFVDVQGNFLVNKAYQFSSITSVTLLDCCTIAWAIVLTWCMYNILSFVGNAASSFMFYTLVPFVLKLSGATMLILSVLTSDMWAVILRIFCYHQQVNWTNYLAFAVVLIGLIIYSTTEKDLLPIPAVENGNYDVQYQRLDDENMASRGKESSDS